METSMAFYVVSSPHHLGRIGCKKWSTWGSDSWSYHFLKPILFFSGSLSRFKHGFMRARDFRSKIGREKPHTHSLCNSKCNLCNKRSLPHTHTHRFIQKGGPLSVQVCEISPHRYSRCSKIALLVHLYSWQLINSHCNSHLISLTLLIKSNHYLIS